MDVPVRHNSLMQCHPRKNKRVTVQRLKDLTADAHGHVDNTDNDNWEDYCTAFASVQTSGGREFWKVDRVEADVSREWTCTYTSKLAEATPDMRIKHGTTYHEIVSVIDVDDAHRVIKIQTRVAV